MATKSPQVYRLSRQIALELLCNRQDVSPSADEKGQCLKYEASCWIDGLTAVTLSEFKRSLQHSASQIPVMNLISFAKAWTGMSLPSPVPVISVSPVLQYAVNRMPQLPPPFRMLACQVAIKCLLYHHSPLPLAAMIVSSREKEEIELEQGVQADLWQYARSLIEFDSIKTPDRLSILWRLVSSSFTSESLLARILDAKDTSSELTSKRSETGSSVQDDAMVLFRQMLHVSKAVEESKIQTACRQVVHTLLPVISMVSFVD